LVRAAALKACALTVSFGQLAVPENLDAVKTALGQPRLTQRRLVHRRPFLQLIERGHIDPASYRVANRLLLKPRLGRTPIQRHLTAFKRRTDGTAGREAWPL
jgi:hypothetical protein